jgi:hypothetical protein
LIFCVADHAESAYGQSMPNQPDSTESATSTTMMTQAEARKHLGISRPTLLKLEADGVLHPVRYGTSSHRRYDSAEVEALRSGGDR